MKMLSELSIANLYIPPLLAYLVASALAYQALKHWVGGPLAWTWHPSLSRFFVLLIILATLFLTV
ncbi:DUF1656 domain-containing protein [Pseudomonas rhodesiae]|jgi:hypothetical protein|nr:MULTISPECIES: DUF1656 domain-containing protein [Pseudomonas]MCX4062950.1 DUF1656 domain-containing protein [Pseudomonas quebecensis]UZW29294.1 DUF1656 domain-containing protein [Pseudomonas quebecensis]WLH41156.1 DUF1656 domain-containing protein [Pseudomonas sp. FP2254]